MLDYDAFGLAVCIDHPEPFPDSFEKPDHASELSERLPAQLYAARLCRIEHLFHVTQHVACILS